MTQNITYPRRVLIRRALKSLSRIAFALLSDFEIQGEENLPSKGPLLVIANHFSFIDPVAVLRTLPYPIEFVGGAEFPHAPAIVKSIPQWWGYYPVFRGTGSRFALRAAEEILKQDGVLGIMPEGGSWAEVLRPARPGAASVRESSAEVQSSRISIPGLPTSARAKATRCFCPPEIDIPRVPISVSNPFGNCWISSFN